MKRLLYKNNLANIKQMKLPVRGLITGVLVIMALILSPTIKAEDIFAELTELQQVESSYVSGRFSHNQKMWTSRSGQRPIDLSAGFSALYSYRCYSQEAVDKARSLLKAYLKKNPSVEVMMRSKDLAGEYVIYEKFNKDDKLVQMVIWSSEGPHLCEIVVVDWNDGLKKKSSTNHEEIVITPFIQDFEFAWDLSNMPDLSDFSDSLVFSDLSELGELDLSGLEELDLSGLEDIDFSGLSEMWGGFNGGDVIIIKPDWNNNMEE